ncbi:MAG: O-antigen ligase family protein [Bacteroidota bacterium]|nr:O-antigen ligase family protein [Bacteroidota bacterium]
MNLGIQDATDKKILIFSLLFVILASIGLWFRLYYFFALPLVLLGTFFILLKPDLIWLMVFFFTPISINPNDVDLGKLSLSLPVEPILFLLTLLFLYLILSRKLIDDAFFTHPISILFYCYFIWMFITSMTSTNVLVSFKFIIAKAWFIIPMYFLSYFYFKDEKNILRFIWLFVITLSLVALFNTVHLSMFSFEDKPSQWTMQPFFKDHTILGAIIAMFIPASIGLINWYKGQYGLKLIAFILFIILSIGLLITFSRAAWVSIIPALIVFLFMRFKISFKYLVVIFIFITFYLLIMSDEIIMSLEKNKVSGSDDLVENVESISNISTDASNLERINRWACALEMWKDKPVFGFGPGTYMFEYAPYQLSGNYTEISTNFGDVGNAHSEYLSLMAETGLLGLIIFLVMFYFVCRTGFRIYKNNINPGDRILAAIALCGLLTYYMHGILNNFLDTDKAAVPFFVFISVLVALEIRGNRKLLVEESSHNY